MSGGEDAGDGDGVRARGLLRDESEVSVVIALAVDRFIRCNRCSQVLALWDDASDDWQPLGARIKRRRTDRGRSSFVCPVCGAMRRIPDEGEDQPESAA